MKPKHKRVLVVGTLWSAEKTKLPKWRIEEKVIEGKTNFLIQQLRTDASKPYYLTQDIYYTRKRAQKVLRYALDHDELPPHI